MHKKIRELEGRPQNYCTSSERGNKGSLPLTVLLGSMYAFRRDLMVPYFFQIARANLGWTLGIAIRDFILSRTMTPRIR
jgi:hypothetical protein